MDTFTAGAGAPQAYVKTGDKTFYATMSLYISNERLTTLFENWTPSQRAAVKDGHPKTTALRRAIDPLFNDVAIRDRNSSIEEFLIAVDGPIQIETIAITLPPAIEWETEGQVFRAEFGHPVWRTLSCRMFWYVHTDGALSYHLSFRMPYAHDFEDFYFLSMFQKFMFPKEFYISEGVVPDEICSSQTGLWLLDEAMVDAAVDPSQPELGGFKLSFWAFIRERFMRHIAELVAKTDLKFHERVNEEDRTPYRLWKQLIEKADFIEVPGLKAPPARSLFLFQDREFFDLLQHGKRQALLANPNYGVRAPLPGAGGKIVIDRSFFEKKPLDAHADFDMRYYFLSGFFQNIIDFLNQDVTELRDGTDPVFPKTKEQDDEAFFIRFANGRALFQVVSKSRSLEVGNDYIGTCPYVFLVHLMALHNEFLARKYERETSAIQDRLDSPQLTAYGSLDALLRREEATDTRELKKATQPFYAFRYQVFTVYKRHLYTNTFRYDTERDLFDDLQQIRSTEARITRCDGVIEGIDRTIEDVEEDKRYQEQQRTASSDRSLNKAVFAVGGFSALQAFYAALDAAKLGEPEHTIASAVLHTLTAVFTVLSVNFAIRALRSMRESTSNQR